MMGEGRELASLTADLRFPSGWRDTLTGWRNTLLPEWRTAGHLLRFVLFRDGATVGSMDPKMKRVFVSDAGEIALSITKVSRRRFTLSPGPALQVPPGDLMPAAEAEAPATGARLAWTAGAPVTLADAEREHILRALRATHWVVRGPNGAATRLSMKRSTLQWKMKKLGISRPE